MECLVSQIEEVGVISPPYIAGEVEYIGFRYISFYYLGTIPVMDLGPYTTEVDLAAWAIWQHLPTVQYVLKDFWSCLDDKALLFDIHQKKLYKGDLEAIIDFVLEENMKAGNYRKTVPQGNE